MGVRGKRAEKPEPKANGETPGIGHNGLTDDQRAALTFDHKKKYEAALAAKRLADAALKQVCKVAKGDLGADAVADIKLMVELATDEGEAKLKADMERRLKVARWMGMPFGSQSDMFGEDRTPAVDRAFALGKKAGLAGETMQPPHAPETEQHRRWVEGFHEGQAVIAKGIKPLTEIEAAAKSAAVDSLAAKH